MTEPSVYLIEEHGGFPNNGNLPVLVYRGVGWESHWTSLWRNGIYGFHHYHSTAHEALGVIQGWVRVQLGGENGPVFELSAGDVVVLPAGVAHKHLESSQDFLVAGTYPEGQSWDMQYGRPGERPVVDETIARVPLPSVDPVYGPGGPLTRLWA